MKLKDVKIIVLDEHLEKETISLNGNQKYMMEKQSLNEIENSVYAIIGKILFSRKVSIVDIEIIYSL
jgi:hypothetical protein